MTFGLLSLLQGAGIIPNSDGPDINVTGKKKDFFAKPQAPLINNLSEDQDAAPIRIGNHDFIQQALQDQQNSAPGSHKGDIQHKGMFGMHGTLRDVLGTLGDAFLLANGGKAAYAGQREKERESDAMMGFTQGDPRAAIERMAAVPGGAEFAQKMYDETVRNQTSMAAQQAAAQKGSDLADYRKATLTDRFGKTVANSLAGAKTPQAKQAVLQQALQRAQLLKIDPAELGITPDMSTDEISAVINSNFPVDKQAMLPISQENANAHMINATRPRQGRVDHGPGISNVDASVGEAVLNGTATPAQSKYYNDRLKKSQKGSVLSQILGTPPAGPNGGHQFQEGQVIHQGGNIFVVKNGKPTLQ